LDHVAKVLAGQGTRKSASKTKAARA
jgi:hypothetical protein